MDMKAQKSCSDLTPYQAMQKFRQIVYICSPYSGDVRKNMEMARRYSRFAVDSGVVPLAPHLLLPQYMNEDTERDLVMFMDMVLLERCEELWVFGAEVGVSDGMAAEIEKAVQRDMKIRYFTEDLKEDAGCR